MEQCYMVWRRCTAIIFLFHRIIVKTTASFLQVFLFSCSYITFNGDQVSVLLIKNLQICKEFRRFGETFYGRSDSTEGRRLGGG